ncbi:hypothetical protein KQI49_05150 [Virgibacillus sp. MSJ-26]|nr:hypothetical protein [Virgibacillus sp. MSJ-26]MBU5466218.1 hypothetical protein [Virgibacillus sp. MSJ-26]
MGNKKSKMPFIFIAVVLVIAGLADLKYKGKFYQSLPKSVQGSMNQYLH